MGRNYSNKNLTNLELGNIEFYLNEGKSRYYLQPCKEISDFFHLFFHGDKLSKCIGITFY